MLAGCASGDRAGRGAASCAAQRRARAAAAALRRARRCGCACAECRPVTGLAENSRSSGCLYGRYAGAGAAGAACGARAGRTPRLRGTGARLGRSSRQVVVDMLCLCKSHGTLKRTVNAWAAAERFSLAPGPALCLLWPWPGSRRNYNSHWQPLKSQHAPAPAPDRLESSWPPRQRPDDILEAAKRRGSVIAPSHTDKGVVGAAAPRAPA